MSNNQSLGLCMVRVLLGSVFIMHGAQKVFGFFSGPGLTLFAGYISGMGFPVWLGYMAAFFELIGGLLLFFGILPKLGALMVIPVMFVAIAKVHWINGYFVQNGGYEYSLSLLILALVVLVAGGGSYVLYNDHSLYNYISSTKK